MAENIDAERATLLDCPFCGSDAVTDFIDDESYLIECNSCGCRTLCGDSEDEAIAAWNRRAPSASIGEDGLPPIEYDRSIDRTYIPLPGGWEIQTKGNGSTFRIAHAQQQTRWQVLEDRLHEPLEGMAHDTRSALAAKDAEIADLRAQLARQSQPAAWKYRALAGNREWRVTLNEDWARSVNGDVDVVPLYAAPPLSSEQLAENVCRSCKRLYTKMGRINADGHCPHCGVEIAEGA